MNILVLNAGSSSQKSCFYHLKEEALSVQPPAPLWEAQIDWSHHQGVAELKVKTIHGAVLKEELKTASRLEGVEYMLKTLWQGETKVIDSLAEIDCVGHRVVHGGDKYNDSTLINKAVKEAIANFAKFAPVHNPVNLEGIVAIEQILGEKVPQVAVFDTAFHAQIPEEAAVYPIPYEFYQQGIRRYGFHGISHQYVSQRAAQLLGKDLTSLKLVTCHLGNGCSLAAVKNGHSIDTTMGFTPTAGLMMGTRSGDIDPGVIIDLLRRGYKEEQIDDIFNRQSGFLGISGVSADLRKIEEAIAQGNSRAKLAYNVYLHSLRSFIGAMIATLGGVDAIIFTAGVGENAAKLRADVCAAFEFLGLKIDAEKNYHHPVDIDISTVDSLVKVLVIHTQEDWAIAQECVRLSQLVMSH
ncbi:acetate kinase [[Phormidium ambiguum] IAM M-71]|uniref:Acetate kinase n=1 Tax=[Phormidium ambiguum] IAM M-71 TaxID=454136 RepID=A0A1U7ILR0_9CYAN|nr:acetate kinase [Phormidium ambiguum]OKH38132.1 acetate kinase [Phormidium ambiguum IAM M-71]